MANYSFQRNSRITSRDDFRRILDKNQRRVCDYFVALWEAAPATDSTLQLGIITSRKLGGAVTRNAIRRRIRESFRQLAPGYAGVGGKLILIGRQRSKHASINELTNKLNWVLRSCRQLS